MATTMTSMLRFVLFIALVAVAGCASTSKPHLKTVLAQQQHAEQAYDTGNLAQALSDYRALTQALPMNADYWFHLGNVYVRMDQPDEAVVAYNHALQREPTHAKAWHNLGIVRLRQAAAAFTQSARTAAGIDAALHQESTNMVHGIATLTAQPALQGPTTPTSVPAVLQPIQTTPTAGPDSERNP